MIGLYVKYARFTGDGWEITTAKVLDKFSDGHQDYYFTQLADGKLDRVKCYLIIELSTKEEYK